jgi:hypothetical protein
MIPFVLTNHATGTNHYIYTAKGRFKKGGNRMCTTLHSVIRALKHSSHAASRARKLVLIADNCSENKNNTLLAFANDLVMRKWYDEVQILFGPVGHTHTGVDAIHKIHNVHVGNFCSPTLVQFISHFEDGWKTAATRPDASIMDVQYNWDAYYQPFIDKIGGFVVSENNPDCVSAFRMARDNSQLVETKWKTDASTTPHWLGYDGTKHTKGFNILKQLPPGCPDEIEGSAPLMESKHLKQVLGKKMKKMMQAVNSASSLKWIDTVATTVYRESACSTVLR